MKAAAGGFYLVVAVFAAVLLRDAQPELTGREIALPAAAIGGATLAVTALAGLLGRLAWTAGDARLASAQKRAQWWGLVIELAPVSLSSVAAATLLAGHATWSADVYTRREPGLIVTALLPLLMFLVIAVRRQRRAKGAAPLRMDAQSATTLFAELGGPSGFAAVVGYPLVFAGMILGLYETSPLAPSLVEYGLVAALGTLAVMSLHGAILSALRGQWGGTIHTGRRGPRTGVAFRLSGAVALGCWAAVFAGTRLYPDLPALRSSAMIGVGTLAVVIVALVRPDKLPVSDWR